MNISVATRSLILAAGLCLVLLVACSEPPAPAPAGGAPMPEAPKLPRPTELVAADAQWELVTRGHVYTDSPVALPGGEVLYAAPIEQQIYRVDAAGNISVFDTATRHTMGLVMGADGRVYGCRNQEAQIVVYDLDGSYDVLLEGEMTPLPNRPKAPGEFCNDVAVSDNGNLWFTDRVNRKVILLTPDGETRVVAEGFRGNGIVLSADQQTLLVTDSTEPRLWAFSVAPDGSLQERPDAFDPVKTVSNLGDEEIPQWRAGTNGMTVDSDGRYYVSSFYGIQIYGPDGSYIGVIDEPDGFVSNLTFAGPELNMLYATGTAGVWRLPMLVNGTGRGTRTLKDFSGGF